MYYHVLIKTKKISILKVDFQNEDILKEKYITPFINNSIFHVDGYLFKKKEIECFLIKTSDLSIEEQNKNRDNSEYLKNKSSIIFNLPSSIFIKQLFFDESFSKDITEEMLKKYNSDFQTNKSIEKNIFLNKKIFIVHGRDNEFKLEVTRFIEKLNLIPVILHEQDNGGDTLIEKIERCSQEINFAVILYTACDKGSKKEEENYNFRARQNVVFEHGYFIAKYGRKNVAAILKENIEIPSDISGIVYINYDNWRLDLAKELKTAGFEVDLNKAI